MEARSGREGRRGTAKSILAREASSARQSSHRTNILEMNRSGRIRQRKKGGKEERERDIFLAPRSISRKKLLKKSYGVGKFGRGSSFRRSQLVRCPASFLLLTPISSSQRRLNERESLPPFLLPSSAKGDLRGERGGGTGKLHGITASPVRSWRHQRR